MSAALLPSPAVPTRRCRCWRNAWPKRPAGGCGRRLHRDRRRGGPGCSRGLGGTLVSGHVTFVDRRHASRRKDMIDTADMVTGMGSPLFDGYRPRFDAASVQGLRESGAVILGKTVTTEFASTHPRGTRNPWDLTRTPGGSSSGSAAAVGCGMLCGGLGTQVVGSILRPVGLLRRVWVQALGGRDQPRRQPGLPQPERYRHDRREPRGCLGDGPRGRRSGGRRSRLSWPDRPADPAAIAAAGAARAVAHRRMADPGHTRARLAGGCTGPAARRRRDGADAGGLPRARRGGSRDGGGAADHHGHQRLGVALAAGQLRGARCLGAQPERAGAACAVACDDAGGVCGAAGPA